MIEARKNLIFNIIDKTGDKTESDLSMWIFRIFFLHWDRKEKNHNTPFKKKALIEGQNDRRYWVKKTNN